MPGSQFIHVQTFSRKSNPGGQSVAQVIGEALRAPEFSAHVKAPRPPYALLGDPEAFALQHDDHVAERSVAVRTKQGLKHRAVRVDRHTLATMIASYPLTYEQLEALPDGVERLRQWEDLTVAWARDRWGDQLKVVLAHEDEAHPHLHLWMLPDDPSADATMLHPGKVAKAQAEARAKSDGLTPREAVAIGNKALKDAMRSFLDDYWMNVGLPCGMTRDGPKRTRLSRAQDQARKAEHERLRGVHAELVEREAEVDEAESSLLQTAREIDHESKKVYYEAYQAGLADGRREASFEVRALLRDLLGKRDKLLALVRPALLKSARSDVAAWFKDFDLSLNGLTGWRAGSGARPSAPVLPPDEPDEPWGPV